MELAVPKPFIFRFDPPDKFQAYAIARAYVGSRNKICGNCSKT